MEINIEKPHGYLKDEDGSVVIKFANWQTGKHQVPDAVDVVEYVEGPTSHTEPVADEYQASMS